MSAKQGYHGTLYQQKKSIPVLRAFMDDVSLMTTSTPASKIALQRTVVALKWVRMKLKPQKSGRLVIKGGKGIDQLPFQVSGEIIPSIQKELLKILGRVCNSVTDILAEDNLKKKIKELVQKIGRHNEGMGILEFVTCNDWMATNDLQNTSILSGISRGIP